MFAYEDGVTAVFESNTSAFTRLYAVHVGDQVPDDYAMASTAFKCMNVQFPSPDIKFLPATDTNGRWLHYTLQRDLGNFGVNMRVSTTCQNGVYVALVGMTFFNNFVEIKAWPPDYLWEHVEINCIDDSPEAFALSVNRGSEATLSRLCASYMERDRIPEAVAYARMLHELMPLATDPALQYAHLVSMLKDKAHAESVVSELSTNFENNSTMVWLHAFTLGELGREEEAMAEYRRAVYKMNDRSPQCMNAFLSYMAKAETLGENVNEVLELTKDTNLPQILYYKAKALVDSGDTEGARQVVDDLVSRGDLTSQTADAIVSIYIGTEHYEEALAVCETIIAQDNPFGHYLKGAVLLNEGKFEDARESLLRCLEKMPNDRNALNLLEVVNARLGKADTADFSLAIEAVPMTAGFEALIPPAPEGFEEDFGAHVEYSGTMYHFEENARARHTRYSRMHVSTTEAVRMFNEVGFPFDPLYERVYVNYLRVYNADGTLKAEGNPRDYYTSDDSSQVAASQKRELHIPVPALEPGCTFEYAVSFQTLGRQQMMPSKVEQLVALVPAQLLFTGASGQTGVISIHTANGVKTVPITEDGSLFNYVQTPPPHTITNNLPPPLKYIPTVWVGSADKTWEGEVENYYEIAEGILEPSPTAAELAMQIVGEDFTPEEAVHKLAEHVREALSYQGLAFGVRAMVPNGCDEILRKRYGDCKDHSYLLFQMLRSVGIEAYMALVDTTGNMNIDVPDSGQFNHMIVYVPGINGGHFIDTTDKSSDERLEPFYLAGFPTLVLDAANPRIVNVPENPVGSNGMLIERTATIGEALDVGIQERVTFKGYWAGYMRALLRDKTRRELSSVLFNQFEIPELGMVRDIKAENLDNLSEDVVLEYTYAAALPFTGSDEKIVGILPVSWELLELRTPCDQPERLAPIQQGIPSSIASTTRIVLPDGYKAATQFAPESLDTPYMAIQTSASVSDEDITANIDYRRMAGIFPAEQRDARVKAFNTALRNLMQPIVLEKR
jgi:tetratricopeptide (TPR) repeat protein